MSFPSFDSLKSTARQRLENSAGAKKVLLVYIAISFGCSLFSLLVNYYLDYQVNQSGGLGNLGLRSMLMSIGTALPMLLSLALMGLDLGYQGAMLRTARGQFTSLNAFRLGFDRFWSLLRCQIAQVGIAFFYVFGGAYAASLIFVLSPLSGDAMALLSGGMPDPAAMTTEEMLALMGAMAPMLLIYFVLMAVFLVPRFYSWRLANYVILDKPGIGGFAALRESTKRMRFHRKALFLLDLRLWWYYGLSLLATVVCYGDAIAPLLGISLPLSAEGAYFLFYFLYLVVQFCILWFFRNRVEVTYALVHEALCPKEEESGVVLGNIFRM